MFPVKLSFVPLSSFEKKNAPYSSHGSQLFFPPMQHHLSSVFKNSTILDYNYLIWILGGIGVACKTHIGPIMMYNKLYVSFPNINDFFMVLPFYFLSVIKYLLQSHYKALSGLMSSRNGVHLLLNGKLVGEAVDEISLDIRK